MVDIDQIDELKKIAELATSGRWVRECDDLFFFVNGWTRHLLETAESSDVSVAQHRRNLDFIAAANPAAVLELIDKLELANARLREVAAVCATAEQERDRLKAENEALRKDAGRLDRLDLECEGYGCEVHEGNRWVLDGPFNSARDAIDALIELKS